MLYVSWSADCARPQHKTLIIYCVVNYSLNCQEAFTTNLNALGICIDKQLNCNKKTEELYSIIKPRYPYN